MSERDESIRGKADELWIDERLQDRYGRRRAVRQAEAVERRAGERAAVELDHARHENEHEAEVLELCSRFVLWAAENDIPYNSPSKLARGWLLGYRVEHHTHTKLRHFKHENRFNGDFAYQHGYDHGPGRSLVFKPSGLVGELATYADRMGSDSTARFRLPHAADPAEYGLVGIEDSIAGFSARHGVEWPIEDD